MNNTLHLFVFTVVDTNVLPKGRERKRDSCWQFVLKLTSSQLRISSCQISGMFTVEGFFFFNQSSRKLKKPCLCFLPLPSVLCRSHIAVRWVGSCLPSFHFFYIPTFTSLLLHEPPLGPPHPIIPYLTPSEINEITTSWLGRSCLLSLPHPTPRHSAITYLFGMGLPHAALAHFPQMFQTLTPSLSGDAFPCYLGNKVKTADPAPLQFCSPSSLQLPSLPSSCFSF